MVPYRALYPNSDPPPRRPDGRGRGSPYRSIGAVRRRLPPLRQRPGEGSLWPLYRGTRAVTST
eukprot:824470-Prymnesium_polylepis.1